MCYKAPKHLNLGNKGLRPSQESVATPDKADPWDVLCALIAWQESGLPTRNRVCDTALTETKSQKNTHELSTMHSPSK